MAFTRWDPLNPMWGSLNQLQSEMNRLFHRWTEEGLPVVQGSSFPAVNVWEEGDEVYLTAELPGIQLSDLEIYVSGSNQLILKGERKPHVPEKAVRHRQERGFGKFSRTLTLPFPVDAEKVEARLEQGVLNLKLVKHESAKPRKIPVTGD